MSVDPFWLFRDSGYGYTNLQGVLGHLWSRLFMGSLKMMGIPVDNI